MKKGGGGEGGRKEGRKERVGARLEIGGWRRKHLFTYSCLVHICTYIHVCKIYNEYIHTMYIHPKGNFTHVCFVYLILGRVTYLKYGIKEMLCIRRIKV